MKWKKPQLPMITKNHFQDTNLLCSLIFQKQESRNLTGLIRKNLRGGTLSLFSL